MEDWGRLRPPGDQHWARVSAEGVHTGTPCFTALHFIELHGYYVYYNLKVCGNPALSESIGAIFPTAFTHFASLCHILAVLAILQTFINIIFVM